MENRNLNLLSAKNTFINTYNCDSEYASFKNALYEHNIYLYNLSERIRNDGWQRHESDIRFWISENNLNVSNINDFCIINYLKISFILLLN